LLRTRLDVLRAEIPHALLRADTETYGELAGRVHDAEEKALDDLLTDVKLAPISRDVHEPRDIDAALRRIANRTYGTCLGCGQPSDPQRLELYPSAKRCLDCQRTREARPAAEAPAEPVASPQGPLTGGSSAGRAAAIAMQAKAV
jgi:RNA polymerase-binding transcription factor DksA